MSLPNIIQSPAYKELADILQTDNELLKKIFAKNNIRQQQFEKLKAQLQKDAVKKQQNDNEFFAALDFSAYLKQIKLSILINARKEEILKALEIEAFRIRETLREQKSYIDNAQEYSSNKANDLAQINDLFANLVAKEAELKSVIDQFNTLQQQLNNWQKLEWTPAVTTAATITAQAIGAQLSVDLACHPVYQALLAGMEEAAPDQSFLVAIAAQQKELELNLAEALSTRASVDNLLKHAPVLANEVQAKCKNTHDAEEQKTAVATVIEPIYKLHNSVILASNIRNFYKHIFQMAKEHNLHKKKKYEALFESFSATSLAVRHTENRNYQALLDSYHSNIRSAYEGHIEDQVELYRLAQKGEQAKSNVEHVLKQLKQLTPHLKSSYETPENLNVTRRTL